jgi:hypothetical protein
MLPTPLPRWPPDLALHSARPRRSEEAGALGSIGPLSPMKLKMNTVPDTIGGAKVIWYSPIDQRHQYTGNTQHIVNGKIADNIYGLAICQYELEEGYYLFGCDQNWQSVTDTFHDTMEDAKDQAEFEYVIIHRSWIRKD